MDDRAHLAPRAVPQQQRARRTIDLIMTVTAELLTDVGVDAFNTNLLAREAGLSPRAIYRYFPNKWAVLRALAERFHQLEQAWMGDLTQFARTDDWRQLVDLSIHNYYRAARNERGFAALRSASRASPELRAFEDEANARIERQLAVGLSGMGISLTEGRMLALCRVIIESTNRILDTCLNLPTDEAEPMLEDLCLMLRGLISHYAPISDPLRAV